MRCEVPEIKRCCFCLPLRHGILILAYFNLIFTIFLIVSEMWMDWGQNPLTTLTGALYRGISIFVRMWFTYILYIMEVIFDIVLLVGAHTKRTRLIRVYYHYGIMTTVATCLTFITMFIMYCPKTWHWFWIWLDLCFAFSGFVLQVYLLLLIRTEMRKLKDERKGYSYENNLTEVVLNQPTLTADGRDLL